MHCQIMNVLCCKKKKKPDPWQYTAQIFPPDSFNTKVFSSVWFSFFRILRPKCVAQISFSFRIKKQIKSISQQVYWHVNFIKKWKYSGNYSKIHTCLPKARARPGEDLLNNKSLTFFDKNAQIKNDNSSRVDQPFCNGRGITRIMRSVEVEEYRRCN